MSEVRPSDPIAVGDVCVIVAACNHPEYIGRECVVTGPLQRRLSLVAGVELLSYEIDVDGQRWVILHRNLRKKRPPAELTTWIEVQKVCGWKPNQVSA